MSQQPPAGEGGAPKKLIYVYIAIAAVTFVFLAGGIYLLLTILGRPSSPSTQGSIIMQSEEQLEGGIVIDPPQELTNFTLTANNGQPLNLSDLQGRFVLVYFGYTHCPDACPATLLDFRKIKRDLEADAENVAFLFISVDGERDTPEFLDDYIKRYDEEFIALSGEDEELERIAPDYNLYFDRRYLSGSQGGYMVDHTASKFLIDQEGRLIRIYSFTTSPTVITEDIRSML